MNRPKYDANEYAADWTTDQIKKQAWAYLLGVYIGDGCVTTNRGRLCFRLNTTDEDFRKATAAALSILTPYAATCSPSQRRKDMPHIKLNYPLVCGDPELCRRLVEATDSKTKIPELPIDTEREFVAGLMDSEGSVNEQRTKRTNRRFDISFKQCFDQNTKMPWIYDFHALLERIGVKPGKVGIGKPYRSHYKTPYRFGINIQSWIDALCYFKIKRKQDRIALWASMPAYAIRDKEQYGKRISL